jgi:hypothetical protein
MDQKYESATPARLAFAARRARAALGRRPDALIVGALLLLPLVVFARAALLRGVFFVHDVQYYFFPYHALPGALLARGALPLWNAYAFSGIPLIGDGQTALFYPPSWLFFLLPGGVALNYDVILQFSIAGATMYLFARALGLLRLPALIGALSFMFCGFLTARVVHLSILSGAALIPLAFLCVEQTLQTKNRELRIENRHPHAIGSRFLVLGSRFWRWFVAAAGAVALQVVSGHPQVPIYTALALGLYTLVQATALGRATRDWRWLYRAPLILAGIYVLGYLLAAIQLVPWVELGRLSPRAAGASFDFVFNNSTAGGDWLLLLFPYLYGSLAAGPYAAQPMPIAAAVRTWEHSAYAGMLALALAAYALVGLYRRADGRSRVATGYFGLLLIGALLFAAGKGTPLAELIYSMPVIGKLRDVERIMALGDFALAALAALGMQRLINRREARRPGLWVIAAALVLLPAGVIVMSRQPAFQQALKLTPQALANLQADRLNAALPLALALAGAALLLWCTRRPLTRRTQALVAALVLLDMGSFAAAFNPTADPQLYQRRPDVLAAFQQEPAPFRKATFLSNNDLDNLTAQETLAVSWGMVYGVEDINGFNSLQPRRYTDFLFGPQVGDVSYGFLTDERLLQPASPILSALNVKYLLVPANLRPRLGSNFHQIYTSAQVRVYQNVLAYPRAFFVDAVRGEADAQSVLPAVTADGFDGRRLALIETARPPAIPPSAGPANVVMSEHGANRMALATDTATPRFLVLSEMYFPGWRAYVDGAETPIYRTNYLFRGIVVPAGQHTVTFEYRPQSVLLGAAISAGALAIALLFAFGPPRSRRTPVNGGAAARRGSSSD